MAHAPLSDADHLRVFELAREAEANGYVPLGLSPKAGQRGASVYVAERLGLKRSATQDRIAKALARFPHDAMSFVDGSLLARRGLVGGPPIPEIGRPPEGFAVYRNSAEYDESGKLKKQWVGTKRDAGDEYAVPAGHVVKGESALVDPDGRVLARWIKTREGAGEGLVDGLRQAFAEYQGAAPLIPAPVACSTEYLTVYPLADLHIGMLAWGKEAGEDFDVKIAVAQMTASITALVQQSQPTQRAVIIILGDYFHSNDARGVTPASGHKLDVDGRWHQVFTAAAKLAVSMINIVALKHADVEVVVLPGNHDPDAAVCLAVALGMFFDGNKRILISQTPAIAWYLRFGVTLMGATHGHTMSFERMAAMLAVDCPEDWGQTTYRTMFTGHIHTDKMREVNTVRVESFSSPSAKDSWTAAAGYRANRALNAITFHREKAEVGRHRVAVGGHRHVVRVKAA